MSSKKFLKGLLTKVVVVNPLGERPHLVYIRKSRKFLEDLQILMENCGVELSSSIRRRGRSFGMYVGVDS
ncbi:MAG: hypothetical protein GWO20_08320, partial [Candidatus Korarchaeota archaeon]|nr:hypothetical protein [Candidatus Korarchaeota archaeon]NIU82021.1 hypothetical protein [Candidatus Thorarchaeota archaeon]NIW13845.1 hypothetical protein [Candidatus Thorarchaeota archaeon]NIW51956.1 hypothetical protein [Candidatus Korarchaeota archaeon]